MFGSFGDIGKAMESIQKYGAIFEQALEMVRDVRAKQDVQCEAHDATTESVRALVKQVNELRAEIKQLREGK